MGHRVLVASGETGSTVSAGSVVAFPATGSDLWNNYDIANLRDLRVVGEFSASEQFKIAVHSNFEDPSTGSVIDVQTGVARASEVGVGVHASSRLEFYFEGPHIHNATWLEIENTSTADMTVEQLGAIWSSHSG